MIPLAKNVVEVRTGDLISVTTLHNSTVTYYLVLKIEPTEDPKLVSYMAIADGKLSTFRRMKKYMSTSSVVSRTD